MGAHSVCICMVSNEWGILNGGRFYGIGEERSKAFRRASNENGQYSAMQNLPGCS